MRLQRENHWQRLGNQNAGRNRKCECSGLTNRTGFAGLFSTVNLMFEQDFHLDFISKSQRRWIVGKTLHVE